MVEGEKVRLRYLEWDDLQFLEKWDRDEEVSQYIGKKFSRKESPQSWFSRVLSDRRKKALAIETIDGALIGNLELEDINWKEGTAELRICIGEKEFWSLGYGTDAVRSLLSFAFEELGFSSIILRVYKYNRRAIACYEKCGFKKEGILRAGRRKLEGFEDMYLMVASNPRYRSRIS